MLKIQDLASKLLIQMAKSMVPFQFEPCSVLTNLNQSAQITSWVIHMKKDHPLRHVQDGVKLAKKYKIHYFLIPMIHLVYPPPPPPPQKRFRISIVSNSLGIYNPSKKTWKQHLRNFFFLGGGG